MHTRDLSVSKVDPLGEPTVITAPPASFFLVQITGRWGRAVSAAQAATRGGCLWTHCGMYVGDHKIVQAEPGGARVRDFDDCYRGHDVLWSDAPIQRHLAEERPGGRIRFDGYEERVRQRVVDAAFSLVDSPYAWLDYVTIAAAEWGWPGWERLVEKSSTRPNLICSALLDRAYTLGGVALFTDDRPRGQVTPADLYRLDDAWTRSRLADLERRMALIEETLR